MLIVIGNPHILSLDPLWRTFMNYVHTGGGWRGTKPDWDPTQDVRDDVQYDADMRRRAEGEIEDTIARLRALIAEKSQDLGVNVDYGHSDSDGEEYLDRPAFREDE